MEKILKKEYQLKYVVSPHHRIYMKVIINRSLIQKEKTLLSKKIKKEFYHYQLIENNNQTIIEVHNENPNLSLLNNLNGER